MHFNVVASIVTKAMNALSRERTSNREKKVAFHIFSFTQYITLLDYTAPVIVLPYQAESLLQQLSAHTLLMASCVCNVWIVICVAGNLFDFLTDSHLVQGCIT